jgi:L-ascorbate metabolism protein UlaG (beta-lactamase superfamily)
MEIIALGHASFKLKGKNASIVIDPYHETIGQKFPKHTTADAVLITHDHKDHNNSTAVEPAVGEKVVVFSGPGEYEIKEIEIVGIDSYHDNENGVERGKNTIYHILIDGVNLVHLGDLGQDKLTDSQIEALGTVNVLFIPVGGKYTINFEKATEIVNQLEPEIVIPMHYKLEGLTSVTEFLKEIGQENIVPLPKVKITKDSLPDKMQVIVLE